MLSERPVLIYRDHLLPASETFIRAQGEHLEHFVAHYAGSRTVPGLQLPVERTLVVNSGGPIGKLKEAAFKTWGIAPAFIGESEKISPVLIHAQFGVGGALALPLQRRLRIPMLVTFHGFDATMKDEFALKSFYGHRVYLRRRETLKRETSQFLAVSQFIRRKMIDQGFPEGKILVHYVGIDTKLFQPDMSMRREPVVLFVGRLVEVKGCEYFLRAAKAVQAAMPHVELVVIGDGPLRPGLETLARSLRLRVRFLGTRPSDQVRSWMNRAKVFCVPSITVESGASEGFGMVFAEAQAMGLPVVSFDNGGIPEAVAHQETGFLVSERDAAGLTDGILRLLGDQALWNRFSHAGRERVRTRFDLTTQTRLLESIYEDVLQGGISHANC